MTRLKVVILYVFFIALSCTTPSVVVDPPRLASPKPQAVDQAQIPIQPRIRPRLAILPFTGGSPEDAESIAEFFSYEAEINRVFAPVPRTRAIETLMKEQQFQRSGLTDSDTIAELGKQLNADYVLAGHIAVLGNSKLLLITIIDVKELQQIAGDYREYQQLERVVDLLPDMAKQIAGAAERDVSGLPRLAVLPFNVLSSGMDQQDAELLAQLLATELANSGVYAVFPRTKAIEKVMEEHHIERSGMTDQESIKAIGEAVNAQYVLSANVRKLGADNYFSASILHIVEASQVPGGTREKYQTVNDGLSLMPKIAQSLTGSAAPMRNVPANMVRVEGGTFQMGSNNGQDWEKPVHTVTVKGFYMGKYEVTQKEWQELMGTTVAQQRDMADRSWSLYGVGDNYPIYYVSWYEAVEYCNKLSLKEGLSPAYRGSGNNIVCDFNATGYRLPTEAEWEYAARGGNKDPMAYEYSGGNSVESVAWYSGNSGNSSHPVGTKQPNSLGLYDMSGNVWEWCWDWYGGYSSGSQTDPTGVSSGTYRVFRGGRWYDGAALVRAANRDNSTPLSRIGSLGFRLVRP
ncbi:MAG: SUMF1/EgtB/PvdO family nonheme iron enzyme [Treponema sp.]|jgi:formylglycine-generating enzyme required for sulfatase activity/TolB-like protein|nr:SUMF1/EgtB/PvdO family nonheme iron enzyme [Treponema sp.]